MNLSQKISELKVSDIFEYPDFIKSGYVFNEQKRIKISTKYNDISFPGLNKEDIILSQIKSEINKSFYNNIIKDLFDTELYSVIDLRGDPKIPAIPDFELIFNNDINKILNELSGYKNIVLSGYLGNIIQDLNFYHSTNLINDYSYIYKLGKLFGIFDIWVDPYMKYWDTRIVGFNDISIRVDDLKLKNDTDGFSASNIEADFVYSYNKPLSKILYILSNNSDSIVFSEYKKIERDIKINKILND